MSVHAYDVTVADFDEKVLAALNFSIHKYIAVCMEVVNFPQ